MNYWNRERYTHPYLQGDCSRIAYCDCCGKPREIDGAHMTYVTIFANPVHVCTDCDRENSRKVQPIRKYSLAAFNPALRRFELDVANRKRDIGLTVEITQGKASYQGIQKLTVDRIAH